MKFYRLDFFALQLIANHNRYSIKHIQYKSNFSVFPLYFKFWWRCISRKFWREGATSPLPPSSPKKNMSLDKNTYDHKLILDSNSEIGAHLRSNICNLTCSMHLIRSRSVTNRIFFYLRKDLFSFLRAQHV